MKVLITCEQSPTAPYIYYQYLGICDKAQVVNAADPFWNSNMKFDIVHIQWPELLVGSRVHEANILQTLENRLQYWKANNAHVVVTRHNYAPHISSVFDPVIFSQIYDLIYSYADAIVHLGNNSLKEFQENLTYSSKINAVINHPNYLVGMENTVSKQEARSKLNINDKDILFLSFGDIRHNAEEQQLIDAFLKLDVENKKLLITRSLFLRNKPGRKHPIKRIKYELLKRKYTSNHIVFDENWIIENSDIQYYMNASDVVISPRINNLNSGVIYLAFSYGKIVVAPDIGNIGEALDKVHNPTFIPKDADSLIGAMEQAVSLLHTDIAGKNLEYVKNECDVYSLGKEYLSLYKDLIHSK